MTSDRIKEIQSITAYPKSVSVHIALLQVWNECEQELSQELSSVEQVKDLLIECCGEVSCEDGLLVGKTPTELYLWIENKFKKN
jgi:hypothetical protein